MTATLSGRAQHSGGCSCRGAMPPRRKEESMKLRMFLFAIAIAAALVLSISRTDAQDKAKPDADMQEMMKKWAEVSTPGEGHKMLEQFVGKWDTISRAWGEGPGKPPSES